MGTERGAIERAAEFTASHLRPQSVAASSMTMKVRSAGGFSAGMHLLQLTAAG